MANNFWHNLSIRRVWCPVLARANLYFPHNLQFICYVFSISPVRSVCCCVRPSPTKGRLNHCTSKKRLLFFRAVLILLLLFAHRVSVFGVFFVRLIPGYKGIYNEFQSYGIINTRIFRMCVCVCVCGDRHTSNRPLRPIRPSNDTNSDEYARYSE